MPVGGGSMTTYEYTISWSPADCKDYPVGMVIRLQFPGPPPSSVILNYESPCVGIVAVLGV